MIRRIRIWLAERAAAKARRAMEDYRTLNNINIWYQAEKKIRYLKYGRNYG